MSLIETGIRGLDEVLGGGFPAQNTLLISGSPGTGKTILGMQFIRNGILIKGEPGVILTFEQFPEMIYRDAASLGWDFRELEKRGQLRVIHTSAQTYLQEMRAPGNLIERAIRDIGAKRCFVDGFLLALSDGRIHKEVEVRQLFDSLRREGLYVMAAKEKPADEASGMSYESFLGDTIIQLNYESDRQRRVRSLEVIKSRGQGFLGGSHSFAIRPDDGLVVYPRFKAPHETTLEIGEFSEERVSTGVAGVDAMTAGGVLRGSTTLVAGVSGVGKSILGLQLLTEGARAGERGLLISFDEPPQFIQRQAVSIGLDVKAAVDSGALVLRHLSPVELEVNRHLHEIRNLVVVGKVRRLVLDAVSIFEAGTDPVSFRDYLVSLVSLLRANGVTTYLISELRDYANLERLTAYGTSCVADNILIMRFLEHRGQVRKVMAVVKARGSDHDRGIHEYRIENGGIRVLPSNSSMDTAGTLPLDEYRNLLLGSVQWHPHTDEGGGASRM